MNKKHAEKLPSTQTDKQQHAKTRSSLKDFNREVSLDPETKALFSRAQYLRKDLEDKLQNFYNKTGLNPSDVVDFLADQNNFSASEWEFIKKHKERLYSEFTAQTGQQIVEKTIATKTEQTGLSKKRKSKSLGSRKNGFL